MSAFQTFCLSPSAATPAAPRGRRAAKSVRIVEVDMEAPYHRFRFTERKIADCPPRPQLPISADEHRESEIAELQDTPEFTFFSPCHRAPPCRQLGIGGRVTVIPGLGVTRYLKRLPQNRFRENCTSRTYIKNGRIVGDARGASTERRAARSWTQSRPPGVIDFGFLRAHFNV